MPRSFVLRAYLAGEPAGARAPSSLGVRRSGDARERAVARAAARAGVAPALRRRAGAQQARCPPARRATRTSRRWRAAARRSWSPASRSGLFLGPALHVLQGGDGGRASRARSRPRRACRCVPLFWLQTEDHDFAEIAHCTVARGAERAAAAARSPTDADAARARSPTACSAPRSPRRSTRSRDALARPPAGAEVAGAARARTTGPGASLGARLRRRARRAVRRRGAARLRSAHAPASRALAAPVYRARARRRRRDRRRAARRARDARSREAGFDAQVHVRAGSPLVVLPRATARGPRYRLDARGGRWRCAGAAQTLRRRELLALLARDPLRFSHLGAAAADRAGHAACRRRRTSAARPRCSYFAQLGAALRRSSGCRCRWSCRARASAASTRARARCLRAARPRRPPTLERPRDALLAPRLAPRRRGEPTRRAPRMRSTRRSTRALARCRRASAAPIRRWRAPPSARARPSSAPSSG